MARTKHQTFRATMYGCDGTNIIVWGPKAQMRISKKDAVRLANVCLAQQKKYVLVDLKRYNKDLKELAQLRKFLEVRQRIDKDEQLYNAVARPFRTR